MHNKVFNMYSLYNSRSENMAIYVDWSSDPMSHGSYLSRYFIKYSNKTVSHTECIVSRETYQVWLILESSKIMLNIIMPQFTCFANKFVLYGQITSKLLKHRLCKSLLASSNKFQWILQFSSLHVIVTD